jgi:general stress protein 26
MTNNRVIPAAERPGMASGYGISSSPEGMLTWAWVDEQMAKSRNYWLCTVSPEGKPHAAPVWGVWYDGTLYFGSDLKARKTRNFKANPAVTVHLESGDETVIFEGSIAELTDMSLLKPIAEAYIRKYFPNNPETDVVTGNPFFYLKPEKVLAWLEKDYPRTATRWRFVS